MKSWKRFFEVLVRFVHDETINSPFLLIPISGGTDGALSLKICHEAYPLKTIAIHAGKDLLCRDWFESLCQVEIIRPPISLPVYDFNYRYQTYGIEEQRWAHFLARSIQLKGRLVGNRNRTEDLLGNYSLASTVANLLPIVNVWKTEVMELCQYVGVPQEILDSSLQPDVDCGRPAELAAIPFIKVEEFLKLKTGQTTEVNFSLLLSPQEFNYLESVYVRNEFKQKLPIRGPRP